MERLSQEFARTGSVTSGGLRVDEWKRKLIIHWLWELMVEKTFKGTCTSPPIFFHFHYKTHT